MWKRGSVKVGQKISYWCLECSRQLQEPTLLFVHWNPWLVVTTRHNHRTKDQPIILNILFLHSMISFLALLEMFLAVLLLSARIPNSLFWVFLVEGQSADVCFVLSVKRQSGGEF